MFARVFAAVFASSVLLAATAAPTPGSGDSQCSTGPVQCCNVTQEASSISKTDEVLLSLLRISVGDVNGLIGFTCAPLGGSSCTAQTVCCENNSFSGIVAIGCSPVNVSL